MQQSTLLDEKALEITMEMLLAPEFTVKPKSLSNQSWSRKLPYLERSNAKNETPNNLFIAYNVESLLFLFHWIKKFLENKEDKNCVKLGKR